MTAHRTDLESMGRAATRNLAACLLIASIACAGSADTNADAVLPDTAAPVSTTPADSAATSPADPDGPEGAAAVIREYYEAITAHDYRRAYLLWSDSGRASSQTFDAFRAGYANTARASVRIGESGRIEGAAGSRYIEIPVVIEATTTSGSMQRFAGTYALRRAVVDGATEAQMRWHIYSADIQACAPSGCPTTSSPDAPAEVADVVRRFGERLRMVSILGPHDALIGAIREQYAPLVTPELLARWVADPSAAPGREVSSPWPARIDIRNAQRESDDAWSIAGDIVEVTSADTSAIVDRTPVRLRVRRGDGSWRIAAILR